MNLDNRLHKPNRLTYLAVTGALCILAIATTSCSRSAQEQIPAQAVNSPAPTLTFQGTSTTETSTPTGPELDATKTAYLAWPIHQWETEVAGGTPVPQTTIVVPT